MAVQVEPQAWREQARMDRHMSQNDVLAPPHGAAHVLEIFLILRRRMAVVIAHHQPLAPVEPPQHRQGRSGQDHVTQMPDLVLRPYDRVPAPHQLLVMFLDGAEGAVRGLEFQDVPMPEMGIGNEECGCHRGQNSGPGVLCHEPQTPFAPASAPSGPITFRHD